MSLFITGTDTNVGKTVVTASIAALLLEHGNRVCIYKPVQTGCAALNAPEDPERVQWLLGQPVPTACSYCFELPAAPYAADPLHTIQPRRILEDFKRLQAQYDVVLVEGAGGVRVPVARHFDILDLARMLQLPVLVVARTNLGTMNHTLLTVDALLAQRLEVKGVLLSQSSPEDIQDPSFATLVPTLEAFLPVPLLGLLPPLLQDKPGCLLEAQNLRHIKNALNLETLGLGMPKMVQI